MQQEIRSEVIHGAGRGKELGYPTANFAVGEYQIPEGLYASLTFLGHEKLPSLTFVGAAKTFGEEQVQIETHILDFDGDLYGKVLNVRLLKKLRDNITFTTKEALIEQMDQDVVVAKVFFSSDEAKG